MNLGDSVPMSAWVALLVLCAVLIAASFAATRGSR